jgi:hypothetical protein
MSNDVLSKNYGLGINPPLESIVKDEEYLRILKVEYQYACPDDCNDSIAYAKKESEFLDTFEESFYDLTKTVNDTTISEPVRERVVKKIIHELGRCRYVRSKNQYGYPEEDPKILIEEYNQARRNLKLKLKFHKDLLAKLEALARLEQEQEILNKKYDEEAEAYFANLRK